MAYVACSVVGSYVFRGDAHCRNQPSKIYN